MVLILFLNVTNEIFSLYDQFKMPIKLLSISKTTYTIKLGSASYKKKKKKNGNVTKFKAEKSEIIM